MPLEDGCRALEVDLAAVARRQRRQRRRVHLDAGGAELAEAEKRTLAIRFRDDRHGYTEAKGPRLWVIIRQADEWAQAQGWQPGPSDA